MSEVNDIFWIDEIREIIKDAKISKSDKQRLDRLCSCYTKLYDIVNTSTQKAMVNKYLGWFHDTFKEEEN